MSRTLRSATLSAVCLIAGCTQPPADAATNGAVYRAWQTQASALEVTANGTVAYMLGPSEAHPGFILQLSGPAAHGLSLEIEENFYRTGPIPLQPGDQVEVRGEYFYNEVGGYIRYTYLGTSNSKYASPHEGGYVRAHGKSYM